MKNLSEEHKKKISESLKGHPCYKNKERNKKIRDGICIERDNSSNREGGIHRMKCLLCEKKDDEFIEQFPSSKKYKRYSIELIRTNIFQNDTKETYYAPENKRIVMLLSDLMKHCLDKLIVEKNWIPKEKVKEAINERFFAINARNKDLELHEFNDVILDILERLGLE